MKPETVRAEELRHVVDRAVRVQVDREQPVVAIDPAGRLSEEIAVHVEERPRPERRKLQPVAVEIENERIDPADFTFREEILQSALHELPDRSIVGRGDALRHSQQLIRMNLDLPDTNAGR